MSGLFMDVKCSPEDQEMVSIGLIRGLGIAPADIYRSVDGIVRIAAEGSRAKGYKFALLPFCHTVEAAAMGADIKPADDTAGPRPGEYVVSSPDEVASRASVRVADHEDARRLLEACGRLAADGWETVYQLTGPISIISSMMDLGKFFKAWRKSPDEAVRCLDALRAMLVAFARDVIASGATHISYSDPVASRDILGPKFGGEFTRAFSLPFIRELIDTCADRCGLLVCPLTAGLMSSCGMIDAGGDATFTAICVKRAGTTGNKKNCRLTA